MNVLSILNIVTFVCALVAATAVHGAGNEEGKISPGWNVFGDGNLFFEVSGSHQGNPCPFDRWAFDTTTAVGKSMYAAFLTAYTSGATVMLYGSGSSCIHGNSEPVGTIYLK